MNTSNKRPLVEETLQVQKEKVSYIQSIDGCSKENAVEHNTDEYESDALVLRKGQTFKIQLNLDNNETKCNCNTMVVVLKNESSLHKRWNTVVQAHILSGQDKNEWYFEVSNKNDSKIELCINIPVYALVSKYNLSVKYFITNENGKKQCQEICYDKDVFILFNSWCKDDRVYMESSELRSEYVLNDTGMVYLNNKRGRPWNFGQFKDVVLRSTFTILESVSKYQRDSAREVVRHLSAKANSCNDGILVGNWSGDYEGGMKPWQWNGSVKIFEKYAETNEPVKYGQCWVFSGIMTSMMRTLGIPCRSVTNYSSAHDTDNNCTFDKFYDEDLEYLEDDSDDSCWNFHVWNDVWMARPDLPSGMGGWQAVDGTPQEESKGIFRCGPAPLQAIKEGNVEYNYDTRFVFAEVNADTVFWQKSIDENGEEKMRAMRIKSNSVGCDISTKSPYSRWREDITSEYKYPEGSLLERASVRNAMTKTRNPALELPSEDVKFSSTVPFDTECDDGVHLVISAENLLSKDVTLQVVVTAQLVRYTGVKIKRMSTKSSRRVLKEKDTYDFVYHYEPTEYADNLDEDVTVRISYMARVLETNQIFVNQKICTVRKPDLILKLVEAAQSKVQAGDKISLNVTVPKICGISKFTNCVLNMEGSILQKEVQQKLSDIECADKEYSFVASFVVKETLKKNKSVDLIVSFDCLQISGITCDLEFQH